MIFQVNLPEDGVYAIFEYYTHKGDDGVTQLRLVKDNGELELRCWLPVKALLAFSDMFRKELAKEKTQ